MSTTITEEARKAERLLRTGTPTSRHHAEELASHNLGVIQQAISAATAEKEAECLRLTKELQSYRNGQAAFSSSDPQPSVQLDHDPERLETFNRVAESLFNEEEISHLRAECERLRAELAAAKEDSALLDFAQSYLSTLSRFTAPDMAGWTHAIQYSNPAKERGEAGPSWKREYGRSVRDTLKIAMSQGKAAS